MPFQYRIPKRFTDLNADGHVDQSVVIDYLQEARTEYLLAAAGPMPAMLNSGVLVTAHQVEYLAPIAGEAPTVDAEVWVDQVGGARFSISYRLGDAGRPVVRARTFLAPYELDAGVLRRLTTVERQLLTAAAAPSVPIEPLGRVRPAELDRGHSAPCRVRWADLDSYRHVNNVKFFDYFGQARLELLAGAGAREPADRWVVVRQDVDYRLPIDFRREPYLTRTAITGIGDSSCMLAADIVDPDPPPAGAEAGPRPFATARTVLARRDADGRPRSIDPDVRSALQGLQR